MSFLSFFIFMYNNMLMVFLITTAPCIRGYTGAARKKALPCWRWCKMYLRSMLVSERNSRYTSTNGGRKVRTNPITSRPHSLPPFLLFLPPSLFLRTLCNDDQRLAAALRGTSTPSIQLVFFTDIFLQFSCTTGTTTTRIPTRSDTALFVSPNLITR